MPFIRMALGCQKYTAQKLGINNNNNSNVQEDNKDVWFCRCGALSTGRAELSKQARTDVKQATFTTSEICFTKMIFLI